MKDNNSIFSKRIIKSVKNFFAVDLFLKMCSLFIAIILWFFVMNTINPTEIKTFSSAITFENMAELNNNGYVVSNLSEFENTSVSIRVEASRPALDELSKAENKANIKVKADLAKLDIENDGVFPKTYMLTITPSIPANSYMYNYNVSNYYPSTIEVVIDKADTKNIPVELREYGSPASGYISFHPKSNVTHVQVTGPASLMSEVEKAVATIDITNANKATTKDCEMTILDEEGSALKGFVISPKTIPVTVDIRKSTSLKINAPQTRGALPEHLKLESIDWSPKTIDIATSLTEPPSAIELTAIDLSNISGSATITQDISETLERLGLESVSSGTNVTITVNVSVVGATEYTIPTSIIRVIGSAADKTITMPDNITAKIGGKGTIDISALAPSIDITGLAPGTHEVPVNLNLPPDTALEGTLEVEVKIKDTAEAATEETTDAEEITESTSETSNK